MRQDRTGGALPFVILRRPSRKRGEIGGPGGAEGGPHDGRGAWAFRALARRWVPGLRREDAACRRMTKEGDQARLRLDSGFGVGAPVSFSVSRRVSKDCDQERLVHAPYEAS